MCNPRSKQRTWPEEEGLEGGLMIIHTSALDKAISLALSAAVSGGSELPVTPGLGDLVASSGLHGELHSHVHTHAQTQVYTCN